MLAQQMQLANAMMPGTQLQPVVRGHKSMHSNIQVLPSTHMHMQYIPSEIAL